VAYFVGPPLVESKYDLY